MLDFTVHTEDFDRLHGLIDRAALQAELATAIQIEMDTRHYVPIFTGAFRLQTTIAENFIIYPGPYARYLYEGKAMEGPFYGPKHATDKKLVYTRTSPIQAGDHWFKKSKVQNLHRWMETADRAVIHYLRR
jgi:hypothetical protein